VVTFLDHRRLDVKRHCREVGFAANWLRATANLREVKQMAIGAS
jgi:hypothetical protein